MKAQATRGLETFRQIGVRRMPGEPPSELPRLLTISETAELLRTTPKAIYLMVERGALPGITRVGRRVLVRSGELLHWLDQKGALSLKE